MDTKLVQFYRIQKRIFDCVICLDFQFYIVFREFISFFEQHTCREKYIDMENNALNATAGTAEGQEYEAMYQI